MGLADPGLRRQKLLRENRHTACQQVLHQALFLLAEFRELLSFYIKDTCG